MTLSPSQPLVTPGVTDPGLSGRSHDESHNESDYYVDFEIEMVNLSNPLFSSVQTLVVEIDFAGLRRVLYNSPHSTKTSAISLSPHRALRYSC